jgi:hypothetical protein
LALTGKLVTAAWAGNAFEDSVADQRLQHGLKVSRRQAMTRCEGLGGNRSPRRLQCHVDNRGNCKKSFAREQSHEQGRNVADGE